jgi:formylglycine-generating enzyme required for sulfatase activity
MFNLLPGDRLWNRFRVEEARNYGTEGAWLSPLQEAARGEPQPNRYFLLPMSKPGTQPLAGMLSVIGAELRRKIVTTTAPKNSRVRRENKPAPVTIPQRLPLIGAVEWIGEPGRDGVALIESPSAIQLSKFIGTAGAISPAQAVQLIFQFTESLQQLLALLSTSRRPLSVSQDLLGSLVPLLNPDCIVLRTEAAELSVHIDFPAAHKPTEPPAWAAFVPHEFYRGEDFKLSSVVFSIAKLMSYLLGLDESQSPRNAGDKRGNPHASWAALAEWASGKVDLAQKLTLEAEKAGLPDCLIELLSQALSRKSSSRISSPEKLLLRLKQPEFNLLLSAARCSVCGFVRSENQSTCICCGHEQQSGSSPTQARPSGTGRSRRGNTTAILKTRSSASNVAVLPKIEGMVYIDAGAFLSGEERTPRTLRAYAIDTVPVTEGAYKRYLADAGKTPRANGPGSREASQDNHPVTGVTWYEANDFAEFYGKRLPTIYEWEKAARGTDGRKFTFGNVYKQGMGRLRTFEDGRKTGESGTAVVGSFPAGASPYGVLDMSGNVLQWTSSARRAGERLFRAVKGSCYTDGSSELARCTSIQYLPPESSEVYLGFRCVKDLE